MDIEKCLLTPEVQKDFDEFWKEIVCNPDGSLNVDQVKRELFDFKMVMDIASEVYCDLTRGRISKPNTHADAIIRVVNDLHTADIQEAENDAYSQALKDAGEWFEKIVYQDFGGGQYVFLDISSAIASLKKGELLKG